MLQTLQIAPVAPKDALFYELPRHRDVILTPWSGISFEMSESGGIFTQSTVTKILPHEITKVDVSRLG